MSIIVAGNTVRITIKESVTRLKIAKGPSGPQGIQGPAGATGATGPQGPAGTGSPSDVTPQPLGTGAPGDATEYSRGNHVHQIPRKLGLICDPRDYGLVACALDGGGTPINQSSGVRIANLAALNAAAAAVADLTYSVLMLPPGVFQLSDTWHVNAPITIMGAGQTYKFGSVLVVPVGKDGIVIDYLGGPISGGAQTGRLSDILIEPLTGISKWGAGQSAVAGATVYIPSDSAGSYKGFAFVCTTSGGSGSVDPFIGFAGGEGSTVTSNTGGVFTARYLAGIKVKAAYEIDSVSSSGFAGDGISVFASTGDGENANSCKISRCKTSGNVGWGYYTQGADTNACLFDSCVAIGNGGDYHTIASLPQNAELKEAYGGFCDNSFVGCSYVACTSEGNRGYSYFVPCNLGGGQVNESRFYGCYAEGGQKTVINQKAAWVFGTCGAGANVFGTGNKIANDNSNTLYFLNDTIGDGSGPSGYLRTGRPQSKTVLEMGWSEDGFRPTQWLRGIVNGGVNAEWAGMLYNGVATPFAWSLNGNAAGGGVGWLASRCFIGPFQSELKPQRLSGDFALTVGGVGATDSLVSHTWNRENGSESPPFATLAAALAYTPKDLNGYTLTITDNRSGAGESLSFGGFINGTVVLVNPRLATVTVRDMALTTTGAVITGLVTLTRCDSDIAGAISGSGRVLVKGRSAKVQLTATSCTGTVLRAEHANYVGYGIAASSCTGNIAEMYNVQFSELVGGGLTGTNAAAPFVVSLTGGGKHVLTGATATSSTANQVDLDGKSISWTMLSQRNRMRAGTFAYWGDNQWTYYGQFVIDNDSSTNYDDLQVQSFQVSVYKKEYCADRALPTTNVGIGDYSAGAYAEVIAHAGGGQGSAVLCGTQMTLIKTCASDGDSVLFGDTTQWPGSGYGTHGEIWNDTTHSPDLFPPTGKAIIIGGTSLGANVAFSMQPGQRINWLTDSDGNFRVR